MFSHLILDSYQLGILQKCFVYLSDSVHFVLATCIVIGKRQSLRLIPVVYRASTYVRLLWRKATRVISTPSPTPGWDASQSQGNPQRGISTCNCGGVV